MSKQRRLSSPATTRRPSTRRDKALPHYDEEVSVPRSILNQVVAMKRCIVAADGSGVSNNEKWRAVTRATVTMLEGDAAGEAVIVTEDGRRWHVTVREARHG